jgi:hypothetical protein
MSYKYRYLMDSVTAVVYVSLVLAVVGFNLWTESSFGVLTLLLLTEIVYAFPAAFPMPLPLYLMATGINTAVISIVVLFAALTEDHAFGGVTSLVLISVFAALTGKFALFAIVIGFAVDFMFAVVPQLTMKAARSRQLDLLSNLERQSFTQLLLLERVIPRVRDPLKLVDDSENLFFAALHRPAFY